MRVVAILVLAKLYLPNCFPNEGAIFENVSTLSPLFFEFMAAHRSLWELKGPDVFSRKRPKSLYGSMIWAE